MLNIINHIRKNTITKPDLNQGNNVNAYKKVTAVNKEWYNSVYAFDKNYTKFLPAVHEYLFKLLNRYFNMTSEQMDLMNKSRKSVKINRSSGRKVWISTPEIKHLNDKLYITVYMYNRIYNVYKKRLNDIKFNWGSMPYIGNKFIKNTNSTTIPNRILKNPHSTYTALKMNINTKSYINMIKWLKTEKHLKIDQYKLDAMELMSKDEDRMSKGLDLIKSERYNYIINLLHKELAYLKLKQSMLFNEFKLSELYIRPIVSILQAMYKKKIIFNIVTLRNFYLNSSILLQILSAKVKSRKMKGSSSKAVDGAISKIRTPVLSAKSLPLVKKESIGKQNIILGYSEFDINKDSVNQFLTNKISSNSIPENNIDELVLKNLEGKSLAGVSIKISGRLTKRYKAERAIVISKSKGTLKNVHSAHKGFSSSLSKGYSNVNVEKSMINSKVRIGAFGITGWISSY